MPNSDSYITTFINYGGGTIFANVNISRKPTLVSASESNQPFKVIHSIKFVDSFTESVIEALNNSKEPPCLGVTKGI